MIEYDCMHCGKPMSSPEGIVGEVETCPGCGGVVLVPSAEPPRKPRPDPPAIPATRANPGSPSRTEPEVIELLKSIRREIGWISFWSKLFVAAAIVGVFWLAVWLVVILSR